METDKNNTGEKTNNSNTKNLSELLSDYEVKWIVLSMDNSNVIASGNTADEIALHIREGIVMKVPKYDGPFTPSLFF